MLLLDYQNPSGVTGDELTGKDKLPVSLPQHFIVPLLRTAQVDSLAPTATLVASRIPGTTTPILLVFVVPSPNSPLSLKPQHSTSEVVVSEGRL